MAIKGKAVFLDKDGTIIENVPYNIDTGLIRFISGTVDGLKLLQEAGFRLIIITNQPGVALGYCTEEEVKAVGNYLFKEFELAGICLSGFYYCPHFTKDDTPMGACRIANPYDKVEAASSRLNKRQDGASTIFSDRLLDQGKCSCRKPAPGLILQAAKEHNIDLEESWFIGDILDDIEAGRKAGCKTILINSGHETEWKLCFNRLPHHVVSNIYEAVKVVMRTNPES